MTFRNMAYKRKAPAKRPFVRRPYKKRRMVKRMTSAMNIKRSFYLETWSPNTATTGGFWRYLGLTFTTVPNYTELQTLFDQYKINGIKYTFRPRYDSFAGNDTVDTTLPGVTNQGGCNVHVINDPYSVIVPGGTYTSGTLNNFLEQGSARTYQGIKPFSVYFKPSVSTTISSDASARRIRAPWLLTSSAGLNHAGFHVFAQDPNLTGNFGQAFDIFVTVYMSFKGAR